MEKVFVMYDLKKGVSIEDYKKWSRNVDQQITPNQPGCHKFEVFEILGSDGEGVPKFQIIELIEVDDWESWQQIVKSKGMGKVVTEWNNYGDENSLITIYGEKIIK